MRTLVYQSHPKNVDPWILRCTATVRAWTEGNGYGYRLLGDELFEGIPLETAIKARSRLPLADMGRLLWAERLLADWNCVIWIDADVLVFDPQELVIDTGLPHLVCREVLVKREKGSTENPVVLLAYNPTVLMFRQRSQLLKRWLAAMRQHAARSRALGDTQLGRELLRKIVPGKSIPAILSVGHFNAAVLKEIYGQDGPSLGLMMAASEVPFAAANLCGHYQLPNSMYLRIIDRLVETAGSVVNDFLPNPQMQPSHSSL